MKIKKRVEVAIFSNNKKFCNWRCDFHKTGKGYPNSCFCILFGVFLKDGGNCCFRCPQCIKEFGGVK